MSDLVLSCKNLCKSYKAPVLYNLNVDLPSGRIIGLLGPNGCGKSTFMKLVSGLLVADSGEIYVCGEERSEKTNAYISYLPERTREDMIPRERKIIYESRVISGYCDIDGNPVDDKDLDDPEERAVAIVMFYVVTILVGIVLPALLLAFGLGMARSKKTGYAKCWYALFVTSVIWILAAILFVLIVIL